MTSLAMAKTRTVVFVQLFTIFTRNTLSIYSGTLQQFQCILEFFCIDNCNECVNLISYANGPV